MRGFGATQLTLQNLAISTNAAKRHGEKITQDERIRMAVRMVNAAARYGGHRPTCLEKSLALWWLLRQQGTVSSVRIGARKVDGKLEAHAWVECEGVVLNEPREEHRHYATFDAAFPLSSERL
jgi:aryl-alcohol dehydrogenase-like predicted oxidoreductase